MNSVNIIGRAGNNPILKHIGDTACPMAEFTLVTTDHKAAKDEAGNRPAMFFNIKAWGTKAEAAAALISKGRRLAISGHLIQERFQPRECPRTVSKVSIIADAFVLLEPPHHAEPPAAEPQTT